MSIGKRIKKRRELLGVSQTGFAQMVEVSKQTLYKYENDIVTNIPSDKIEKMAEVLDCDPAYLMGWETQVPDDEVQKVMVEYRNADEETRKMVKRILMIDDNMRNKK